MKFNILYLIQISFFKAIILIDEFLYLIFKKNFKYNLASFLNKELIVKKKIKTKSLILYSPSKLIKWRIDTLFSKEPKTLEWIDNFEKYVDKPIFWDIGSNIGLYSIYAAIDNSNTKVISFEPSPSNLSILSKNISFNNLEERIFICQNPITKKESDYFKFVESSIEPGNSINTLISEEANGLILDKSGKKLNYYLFSNSLNYFIKNSILEIPNFIKIDVDGNEHEILEGARAFLDNKKIVSILVEIDDNKTKNKNEIIDLTSKHGFEIKQKDRLTSDESSNFYHTYNYIFFKK